MNAENAQTLAAALARAWQRWPQRVALVDDSHRLTYAGFAQAVAGLTDTYRRLGVAQGERIVCSVANRCEYLVALAAAWTHGAVHVGIDHQSTGPELAAVIELTGSGTLIYEPSGDLPNPLAPLEIIRRRHPNLRILVVTDHLVPGEYTRWSVRSDTGAGVVQVEPPERGPAPDDPAIIFITSGTTGVPKATIGFHGNLAQRWQRLGGWLRFSPDDVHLAQLPLSHGFGLMMAVAALLNGGRLVLLERFSAEEALAVVDTEGVTVLNGAPAHFKLIVDRLDPTRHNVGPLRLSVGTAAPFPPELVNAIWECLGVEFMFMYGSSEGVGVATTDAADILRGSVGRPQPGSVMVVDPDREPLPTGSVGEVAFSRAVYPVRYWGDANALKPPEPASSSAAGAGWYYSGDLGHLDDEGRLYIHGRIKHQIDRGGLKVDPVEVETALLRCPGVADAAVIGQPNPVLGETVCACVAPATGRHPTLGSLRTALGRALAPFKLPEELFLLDSIPRTRIGKVDLPQLRQTIAAMTSQRLVRR
jgi:acyl-CoA synthetase (AMP-forming)/AMP-acid ligase II